MPIFNNDHQPGPPGLQLLIWGVVAWIVTLAAAWRHAPPGQVLSYVGVFALSPLLGGLMLWSPSLKRSGWTGFSLYKQFDFDTYWLGWFGAAFLIGAGLSLMLIFNIRLA